MKQPNIILIMTDQLRGDCLGASGHPDVKTPYLDTVSYTHLESWKYRPWNWQALGSPTPMKPPPLSTKARIFVTTFSSTQFSAPLQEVYASPALMMTRISGSVSYTHLMGVKFTRPIFSIKISSFPEVHAALSTVCSDRSSLS